MSLRRVLSLLPSFTCRIRPYHSIVREEQPMRIDVDPFGGKKIISEPKETYTDVEESKEEFKFVEKLISSGCVPEPPQHENYPTPSGWVPQKVDPDDLAYFVRRTRFHNFPVYLQVMSGGSRKMTVIRNVEGDIWALETEICEFLHNKTNKKVYTQVDEVTRKVRIRGVAMRDVAEFLLHKGL